jgi:hypothetical protein
LIGCVFSGPSSTIRESLLYFYLIVFRGCEVRRGAKPIVHYGSTLG